MAPLDHFKNLEGKEDALSDTLTTVARLIEEALGSPSLAPITAETSFANDLEIESIELVSLFEKLQAEYGDQVDFATWAAGKEINEMIMLTVGQLVEYIDQCLSS